VNVFLNVQCIRRLISPTTFSEKIGSSTIRASQNNEKMQRIDKTVFISYRRADVPWALAIAQNLTHQGYDVFFDYIGINSGDFEQVILANVRSRAHFVVLLTPSAPDGCDRPND